MLVVIVIVLRFDVAVLEVFVPMNDAAHARRFWVWRRSLSVILHRDERGGTVSVVGGEAEGKDSSSRSDCLNQKMDVS